MKPFFDNLFKTIDVYTERKVGITSGIYISSLILVLIPGWIPSLLGFLLGSLPLGLVFAWQVTRNHLKSPMFIGNLALACIFIISLLLPSEADTKYKVLLILATIGSNVFLLLRLQPGRTSDSQNTYDPNVSLDGATMDEPMADFGTHSLGDDITFAGGNYSEGDADSSYSLQGNSSKPLLGDSNLSDLNTRYEIESELGKGGMGEVLLATDTRLNRKVAIKRILQGQNKAAADTFLGEAQTVANLNHPNIVQVYDYGVDRTGPYIVMEYLSGGSLSDICRGQKVEVDRAIEIMSQLCDGLSSAHDSGIIHRDIKPANILMNSEGTPKLSDFGLATTQASLAKNARAIVGTLDFMAPEQRAGAAETDHRSDIYSLGATMYQLLTGRSPKLIKLNDVPKQFHDMLTSCLEEAKNDRFESVAELKQALTSSYNATLLLERELSDGECGECGIVNKLESTFCRHCGSQLSYACLQCGETTAVWDKICSGCGANQLQLVADLRKHQEAQRQECDSLLNSCRFAQSHKLAEEIKNNSPPQLPVNTWFDQFIKKLDRRKKAEVDRAKELIAEATCHETEYDYESAIQCLTLVPEPVRHLVTDGDTDLNTKLKSVTQKHNRLQELEVEVKEAVTAGRLNGLLAVFDELLELRPDRPAVIAYRDKLLNRQASLLDKREISAEAAKRAFSQQSYSRTLEILKRIPQEAQTDEDRQLEIECQRIITEINTLRNEIAARVQDENFYDLLELVERCLTLNSNQQDLQTVRVDLLAFEQKVAARTAVGEQHVLRMFSKLAFQDAANLIQKLPPKEHSDLLIEYAERTHHIIPLQIDAMERVRVCRERRPTAADKRAVQHYEIALAKFDLHDPRIAGFHSEVTATSKRRNSIWLAIIVGCLGLAGAYIAYDQFIKDAHVEQKDNTNPTTTDE